MSLNHDAFSHPLPKLRLCGPKFLAVAADHQRCFLLFCLFLLLFFGIHFFTRSVSTPVALHVLRICIRKWSHTVPRGETSMARRHQVVKELEISNFGFAKSSLPIGPFECWCWIANEHLLDRNPKSKFAIRNSLPKFSLHEQS